MWKVFLGILFSFLATTGLSLSWEQAIRNVEKAANEYAAFEKARSGFFDPGRMYYGYMYEEHTCAVLGRMLERKHLINHLETFDYPPMDNRTDTQDILIFVQSLRNWAHTAKKQYAASDAKRISTWNLECVGKYGIAANAWIANDNPAAEFDYDAQIKTLYVYGDIDVNFYNRFQRILMRYPQTRTVSLGSGGGSVSDAIQAGLLIRTKGLMTYTHGPCYSACPLVFFGGNKRHMWNGPNRLGFHQVSKNGKALSSKHQIYSVMYSYLEDMGVDGHTVINWMLRASPYSMYEPNFGALCAARAATWIQYHC